MMSSEFFTCPGCGTSEKRRPERIIGPHCDAAGYPCTCQGLPEPQEMVTITGTPKEIVEELRRRGFNAERAAELMEQRLPRGTRAITLNVRARRDASASFPERPLDEVEDELRERHDRGGDEQ